MSIINDFKSINSIMNRREQKPEHKEPVNVGWPYGPAVPTVNKATAQMGFDKEEFMKAWGVRL